MVDLRLLQRHRHGVGLEISRKLGIPLIDLYGAVQKRRVLARIDGGEVVLSLEA